MPSKPARKARLLTLFRSLHAREQAALVTYAEQLASAQAQQTSARAGAQPGESVVQAIRRLTRAYPGLDRASLMSKAAALLAGHMLEGRATGDVVDELERLYADAARQLPKVRHSQPRSTRR